MSFGCFLSTSPKKKTLYEKPKSPKSQTWQVHEPAVSPLNKEPYHISPLFVSLSCLFIHMFILIHLNVKVLGNASTVLLLAPTVLPKLTHNHIIHKYYSRFLIYFVATNCNTTTLCSSHAIEATVNNHSLNLFLNSCAEADCCLEN